MVEQVYLTDGEWEDVQRRLRGARPPRSDDVGFQDAETGRDMTPSEVEDRRRLNRVEIAAWRAANDNNG